MSERGIEIELTDDARTLLGNLGYDPTYGARPLKRVIQKRLVDKLALRILEGEFTDGDRVRVDAADGELASRRRLAAVPVFRIPPGVTAAISGLTIADGRIAGGNGGTAGAFGGNGGAGGNSNVVGQTGSERGQRR